MRTILVFILITTFCLAAQAADYVNGYIVLANNDTVKCKFKVGGLVLSRGFTRLAITTEQGEEQVYHGKDKKVLGYGFVEKGRKYDFIYVDVKPKVESGFYQRIVDGAKYKLYVHVISTSTYPGIASGSPQYVLFNTSGEYKKFETCIACPWKKHLRELLKDDAKALEVLETTSRLDIPKFVVEINKAW